MKKIKWYHVGVFGPYVAATLAAYYFVEDKFWFWYLIALPLVLLFTFSIGTWINKSKTLD